MTSTRAVLEEEKEEKKEEEEEEEKEKEEEKRKEEEKPKEKKQDYRRKRRKIKFSLSKALGGDGWSVIPGEAIELCLFGRGVLDEGMSGMGVFELGHVTTRRLWRLA